MAQLNWAYEAGAAAARRTLQAGAERYFAEGQAAPAGAECPYPATSWAAIHWRRGKASREGESA
ncbi:MAG: hypothetical protein A2Y38_16805 [Spirochaetes bacterium GWB1_59_5]|nr:MAG: hypothetical protein A2Y38_16805 [Spirochaetes bacterium GWB1_59_5]